MTVKQMILVIEACTNMLQNKNIMHLRTLQMIKFCVDAAVYDLREKSQTSHSVKFNFDSFGTGKLCNQNQSP